MWEWLRLQLVPHPNCYEEPVTLPCCGIVIFCKSCMETCQHRDCECTGIDDPGSSWLVRVACLNQALICGRGSSHLHQTIWDHGVANPGHAVAEHWAECGVRLVIPKLVIPESLCFTVLYTQYLPMLKVWYTDLIFKYMSIDHMFIANQHLLIETDRFSRADDSNSILLVRGKQAINANVCGMS